MKRAPFDVWSVKAPRARGVNRLAKKLTAPTTAARAALPNIRDVRLIRPRMRARTSSRCNWRRSTRQSRRNI